MASTYDDKKIGNIVQKRKYQLERQYHNERKAEHLQTRENSQENGLARDRDRHPTGFR